MLLKILVVLLGIGLSALSAYFCFENAHKPHDNPEPRMVPWSFLALLSSVFGLLLVALLFNLFGVETGPDKMPFGRMM